MVCVSLIFQYFSLLIHVHHTCEAHLHLHLCEWEMDYFCRCQKSDETSK